MIYIVCTRMSYGSLIRSKPFSAEGPEEARDKQLEILASLGQGKDVQSVRVEKVGGGLIEYIKVGETWITFDPRKLPKGSPNTTITHGQ